MRRWHRALSALCLALLVLVRPGIDAAPPQTSPQLVVPENASVDELLSIADKLWSEAKGNTAFPLYERALAGAEQRGLELQQAQAHHGIARVLNYRTQYATARDHALKAAEIYERLGNTQLFGRISVLLSGIEEVSGQLANARTHAERAVAAYNTIEDPRGRAYATLQFIRVAGKDLDGERPLYASALADARTAGDIPLEASILHSLGDHQFTGNKFEESLETLLQAESLLLGTNDVLELGTVYNSIGRVYRAHGRLDEALRFQLKALALHEKGGSAFEIIQSRNAVATVYERLSNPQAAREYYDRALALAEKSSSQRIQDFLRANLSLVLINEGQYARAATELERVLARGLDAFPARRQRSLSLAYSKLNRHEDALAAATKAVDSCNGDETFCGDALGRRAAAHAALGNVQAALADLNAALEFLERLRIKLVPSDFFKQDFSLAQQYIYSQAIALQVQHKHDRQALETAELARARAFLDLLASREVQVKASDRQVIASLQRDEIPVPSRIELQTSNRPRAPALTLRGDRGGDGATTTAARSTGRDLELRSFVSATPSAADDLVATAARLQSTLVVYWVGDDELFIWTVSPAGTITARRVAVLRSRLVELIRETSPFSETTGLGRGTDRDSDRLTSIVTRGESTIPTRAAKPVAWRALYDLLIQPIRSTLPTTPGALLTIVPQGPLLNVSFAALQNAQGRYLLEDYALHYAPAGAVLQFTAPKKRADARTGPMLLVSDPALPKLTSLDRPLPRLPGARSEASRIARLVPASRLTVLQDGVATEARTRDLVGGKAVLHFATHAIVKDNDPFASFLALGPSTTGGSSDGMLTSQEVYGLDLNADLVVLSACRSAGGSVTGDGISAFARAFIYAGTASLVASLWDVADEPTNRLLPDFYRTWLNGNSKSRALRAAQLRLLRDLRAGRVRINTAAGEVAVPEHPVFWAGFALFGEPE
jgi:CHAT domain-containing protein/tetratricopeptide (TPR) repeat protein